MARLWPVLLGAVAVAFQGSHGGTTATGRRPGRVSLGAAAASADPFSASDARPIVLYDGVCRMCNFWVDWVLANDPDKLVRFAALQSDVGRALLERSGRRADDISSIVLVTASRAFVKSDAVFEIGRTLKVTTPIASVGQALVPKPIADAAYDAIAENRYSIMGKFAATRVTDDRDGDRFLGADVA